MWLDTLAITTTSLFLTHPFRNGSDATSPYKSLPCGYGRSEDPELAMYGEPVSFPEIYKPAGEAKVGQDGALSMRTRAVARFLIDVVGSRVSSP